MTARRFLWGLVLVAVLCGAQSGHRQRRWAIYEHEMQDPVDDPPDAWENTEFSFARLRFRSHRDGFRYARWGIDANKSDRQFLLGVRRLTRIHTRSVEHIVDIDSDEIFDWPWLYGVAIGDWTLSDSQVERLRKYFERGGFLMVDDFHGQSEWRPFAQGIARIFPGRTMVELPDDHPIFHVLYDLTHRIQVPGQNVVHGPGYERDGVVPHWRGLIDDRNRVVVAACFNMDLGDAWEFADDPDYPERFSTHAYQLGINYILYSMTH